MGERWKEGDKQKVGGRAYSSAGEGQASFVLVHGVNHSQLCCQLPQWVCSNGIGELVSYTWQWFVGLQGRERPLTHSLTPRDMIIMLPLPTLLSSLTLHYTSTVSAVYIYTCIQLSRYSVTFYIRNAVQQRVSLSSSGKLMTVLSLKITVKHYHN